MPNIFIRNGMGTNLDLITGYKGGFHGFPQSIHANDEKVPRLGHECFLLHLYHVIIHPSIEEMQPETAN